MMLQPIRQPMQAASHLSLALAIVMLVLGLTVWAKRLTGFGFLVYWTVCFCLTAVAAGLALLDVMAIRRQSREAQRALIEEALGELDKDKHKRD